MKVVLDTNVIVSGFLTPSGPPGGIVRMVAAGLLSLGHDARIMAEYERVLSRSEFDLHPLDVNIFLEKVRDTGWIATGVSMRVALHDPSDAPFVEVALAGGAEALVTGNLRHFPPSRCEGLQVLSPKDFLDYYRLRGKR